MNDVDVVALVEELKDSLIAAATGGAATIDEAKFKRTRQALLQHPDLASRVPGWLQRGKTHWEAVKRVSEHISEQEGGDMPGIWNRRRTLIADGLNPMIDAIEAMDLNAIASMDLGERLGGGGFGEVYRCRHRLVNVDFAVKVLHPAFAEDKDHAIERFLREARILFSLNHRAIVRVFDVGMRGRRPFIRMELVEGHTLLKTIQSGAMTAADARELIVQVASGLRHAHENGVVHRDLKPSNVMISTRDRRVVVLDFGLGAFVEDEIASRITRTGERAAAGLYTAPELVADPRLLEPRTDIYSLGALWYEGLVGRPPSGTRVETALDDVFGLRASERELLLRCLGPIKERPDAAEVLRDIVASGVPKVETDTVRTPSTRPPQLPKPKAREWTPSPKGFEALCLLLERGSYEEVSYLATQAKLGMTGPDFDLMAHELSIHGFVDVLGIDRSGRRLQLTSKAMTYLANNRPRQQ